MKQNTPLIFSSFKVRRNGVEVDVKLSDICIVRRNGVEVDVKLLIANNLALIAISEVVQNWPPPQKQQEEIGSTSTAII
ncbi:hypothetical protein K1719_019648 [Acacia pycnantha]|nr:hypothetical protein K1719_019648 [Acacia pycnantha]